MTTGDWSDKAASLDFNISNRVNAQKVNSSGEALYKYSPRDGSVLYELGQGNQQDVDESVAAAKNAFEDGRWASMPVSQRKMVLSQWADLIQADAEYFALCESLDVGKPIHDALNMDVPIALTLLRYSIEGCDKVYGNVYPGDHRSFAMDILKPRGVVAGIVGWNFPLVLAMMKIAPALAMGNSLVIKPSELSSLSMGRLVDLALQAGVPEGVFNLVNGAGATVGNALAHHPDVDLLTFTGSSQTGKQLLIASGQSNMKRLLLECGGKSPNIIFDDVDDLPGIVDAVIAKMYWNQGQVCTAGSRLLLSKKIKDSFLELLCEKVAALPLGDPLDDSTRMGPLISEAQLIKVQSYIESGKRDGASLLLGGEVPGSFDAGFYLQPCVFDGVQADHQIAQEEIFGPVLSVMTFDNDEHAVQLANSTIYGLAATVWTSNIQRAQAMAYGLSAGELTVRASTAVTAGVPLGTMPLEGHKQSGLGSESGLQGLRNYTISTSLQMFS